MRTWNVPDTLNFLEYQFLVEPDKKKIVTLEFPQPLDMAFYQVKREGTYLSEFSIDGSPQNNHDHDIKLFFFDKPQYVTEYISFIAYGDSLTFPEEITIQLFYK